MKKKLFCASQVASGGWPRVYEMDESEMRVYDTSSVRVHQNILSIRHAQAQDMCARCDQRLLTTRTRQTHSSESTFNHRTPHTNRMGK